MYRFCRALFLVFFNFQNNLKVFYKFYRFCRFYRILFGKTQLYAVKVSKHEHM